MISLKIMGDERGSLIALENNKNIPFDIQRVYFIYGTREDVRRGCHAHRDLKQVLVCVNGKCKVLLDDGQSQHTVVLDDPSQGLLVGEMIWREMYDFSKDCVLMVLANKLYDPNDYIKDYQEFKEAALKINVFLTY